jgi:hypothetical protein
MEITLAKPPMPIRPAADATEAVLEAVNHLKVSVLAD